MIGKNFKYNWLDMSPANVYSTKIALSNVEGVTSQRTNIVDNVNDHGSTASNTLEGWRLFSFDWYISAITKVEKGTAWALLTSKVNIEPYVNVDPYKKLEFQSDLGVDLWVMAKVNKKPKGSNGVNDPRIVFWFELYAETNELYWTTLHSASWSASIFGWTNFANKFWNSRGASSGSSLCNNAGNFKAGCAITAVGTLVNPRIKNLTNGQEFKIDWTTTNLELNSLLWKWTVKDEGVDIMYKRESWVPIYLTPWDNSIMITDDVGATSSFIVQRYDTWNTI